MKYVSIDIETGGLDPLVHPILEVGAVCAEIGKPGIRSTFRALIVPKDMDKIVVSPYTALLHRRVWESLEAFKKNKRPTGTQVIGLTDTVGCLFACEIGNQLRRWVNEVWPRNTNTDPQLCNVGRPKITIAGKNISTFDLPFLRAQTDIDKHLDIRHRTLAVTSHFYRPGDECLPNLDTCLERAGINKRTEHGALSDALLVCDLIDFVYK